MTREQADLMNDIITAILLAPIVTATLLYVFLTTWEAALS